MTFRNFTRSIRSIPGGIRNAGFSLIELLVVVAILSLLAAIALPNYLEAQTRSKVSRTKADLRTLAIGLESYHVEHKAYPQAAAVFPSQRLRPLTTPVAYLTSLPVDPFATNSIVKVYLYGAMDLTAASRWLLAGRGPDLRPSTDPIEFYPGWREGLFEGADPDFNYMIYDPTNGTVSWGDVYRSSDYQFY